MAPESDGGLLPDRDAIGGFWQRVSGSRSRRWLAGLLALAALATVGTFIAAEVLLKRDWPFPGHAGGRWVTDVVVLDGEPMDFNGALTISDASATVERPCNTLTIKRSGDRLSTLRGCIGGEFDREAAEDAFTEAIEAGGRIDGDRLVFESERIELRYRRVDE